MVLDAPELDPEESLSNLGLDSLMALELQHSLEESFGAKLPIEILMGMPSHERVRNPPTGHPGKAIYNAGAGNNG